MSITTCFPVGSSDNNYLNLNNNDNNNHHDQNSNTNLINSTNQNFLRNKINSNQQQNSNQLITSNVLINSNSSNVIQNSKSDLMISGFDSFPLSRSTTPIPYITSSLDGYLSSNSTLGTPNPQINSTLNNLNRCSSSNSNCSTNSKLNNLTPNSRPASSFDNFLINNDSNDSNQTNNQPISHQASVVSYYPHIILNENNLNYSNNLNSQTNSTSTIHHSSNFNNQVKEEYLENSNYQSVDYNLVSNQQALPSSTTNNLNIVNINKTTNSTNQEDSENSLQNIELNSTFVSGSKNCSGKKRRSKIPGPPARPRCAECDKTFSNQSALSKHKLTHSDERKFVCSLCSKAFKRQDHLNGHLLTHRDKKPFECDVAGCEKTYCDARSLKRHKENHHAIFGQLAFPLLSKNLPADIANNLISVVKSSDGSRIQYAPASSTDGENNDLDLSNAILDPSLLNLSDNSHNNLLQQLISQQVDGNSAALSILQQHIAEQQSNYVECPTCQKKFKNLPALNGHMRLHGGYVRGSQPSMSNNNEKPNNKIENQVNLKPEINGPIDLIKKEISNFESQQQSQNLDHPNHSTSSDLASNDVKNKARKQIANTPVIIENPEANRFQISSSNNSITNNTTNDNNNSNRLQYYSNDHNNLITPSVINTNPNLSSYQNSVVNNQVSNTININPINSTLTSKINTQDKISSPHLSHISIENNSSPVNEMIQSNENNLLSHEKITHSNSWLNNTENVSHLKEQLNQQFRIPNQPKINDLSQPITIKINQSSNRNICSTIPSHVFNSGEKFRRHSDSTAEIRTQNSVNNFNSPNGIVNQHMNSHSITPTMQSQQNNHVQPQNINTIIPHQLEYENQANTMSQVDNNRNPILNNYEYIKRKNLRTDSDNNISEQMQILQESQIMNTTPSNYLPNNNNSNIHQVFYNNNNNCNNNTYHQSHSVPSTPTVNQHFFNQRSDLQNLEYEHLTNPTPISHHSQSSNQQHSLPCTPKQTSSFTFSPHQVQHYHQQQSQSYHHYNSSPTTPMTPLTPTSVNCNYQENLISRQQSQNINLQLSMQNNQVMPINSLQKNVNNYHENVEFVNNNVCSRNKFNQQNINYGMGQFVNNNLTNDQLNGTYSNIINESYPMINNNNEYSENFNNCHNNQQPMNESIDYKRNIDYCQNDNSTINCAMTNYTSNNIPSNVIMSNYSSVTDSYCETNLQKETRNQQINSSLINELTNGDSIKECLSLNSSSCNEKPTYTRVTLRSVSPNLVIATDALKNSNADDSQNFTNLCDETFEEDDDVFLSPAPIPSPKNNFTIKKNKSLNSANGTYLAGNQNINSTISSNLPRVDFTHPQQSKFSLSFNENEINDKKISEEQPINDINFNLIKINLVDKENQNFSESSNNLSNCLIENNKIDNKLSKQFRANSPKKFKHRPEPLYIPPHVNARIYKSPRVWTQISDGSNLPPPYTPPPMLSPVPTNSSYYWHILTGNSTPKTMSKFFISRKANEINQNLNNKNRSFDFFNENNDNNLLTPSTAYEPLDSSLPKEESLFDFSQSLSTIAHVNIGVQYQARIPVFNPNKEHAKILYKNEKAEKLWDPTILEKINSGISNNSVISYKKKPNALNSLELYLELSCSSCVLGNGRNKEYAFHLLYLNNGDLKKSIMQLLKPETLIKPGFLLYDYKYPETDIWTTEEMHSYYEALLKYDKDFLTISKNIKTKTVKQCIEFYYLWKIMRPDEYKKHRIIRRKKEQEGIFYNISKN